MLDRGDLVESSQAPGPVRRLGTVRIEGLKEPEGRRSRRCRGDVVRVLGVRPSLAFRRSGTCGIAKRGARFFAALEALQEVSPNR